MPAVNAPILINVDDRTWHHAQRALFPGPLKFGDLAQISAIKFLVLFESAAACMDVNGFNLKCFCCGGAGYLDCQNAACRIRHSCDICGGAGYLKLTRARLKEFNREQLQSVIAELSELTEAA